MKQCKKCRINVKTDEEICPKTAYGGVPYLKAGKACNSYEMYQEDIQLLKQMNLNTYRMSLEWSRIEPVEGVFNEKEIPKTVEKMAGEISNYFNYPVNNYHTITPHDHTETFKIINKKLNELEKLVNESNKR